LAPWHPPWTLADLCRAVGRGPKDGTVRRVVDRLEDQGILYRGDDNRWYALGAFFHTNGNGNGGAS
jgi:DNA-binding IclR family transcriptional regulator